MSRYTLRDNYGVSYSSVTSGVKKLMDKGYYWFISDMDIASEFECKGEEFLVFKLITDLENETAVATIDDGNENVLYTQEYPYTDSKIKEVKVWKTGGVILLPEEY